MANFPVGRSFILDPANWHSLTGAVSVTVGSLFDEDEFPPERLIDGSAGPLTRFATTSVGVQVELTGESPVNMLGLLTHNLDPWLLIQPYVDGVALSRTFGVKYPHCWIDLRAFADVGTTFELRVAGNSRPITFGEIVVGQAGLYEGTIEVPFAPTITPMVTRAYTNFGNLLETSHGTLTRALRLRMHLNQGEQAQLSAALTNALELERPLVVAPSSLQNDLYVLTAGDTRLYEFERSLLLATYALEGVEDAHGVT